MSLFGSSPPADHSGLGASTSFANSRSSLFDDEPPMTRSTSSALFADDDSGASSPWDMPTPRKQTTRADLIRALLPPSDVPDSYVSAFDAVARGDGQGGRITAGGVAQTLAAARLGADEHARVMSVLAPLQSSGGELSLGRSEFNVLLALIGLAQEGEIISLDGVDERRRSKSSTVHSCCLPTLCFRALAPLPLPSPSPSPNHAHCNNHYRVFTFACQSYSAVLAYPIQSHGPISLAAPTFGSASGVHLVPLSVKPWPRGSRTPSSSSGSLSPSPSQTNRNA